jgi:hypothetical protein
MTPPFHARSICVVKNMMESAQLKHYAIITNIVKTFTLEVNKSLC